MSADYISAYEGATDELQKSALPAAVDLIHLHHQFKREFKISKRKIILKILLVFYCSTNIE